MRTILAFIAIGTLYIYFFGSEQLKRLLNQTNDNFTDIDFDDGGRELNYGVYNKNEIINLADEVVEVLGGGENAKRLLLETVAAETNFGKAKDKTWSSGIGLTQFDYIGFIDVKQRTPKKIKQKIKTNWGINIDRVRLDDLRYNPKLAMIFTRLKYMLVPKPIPSTLQDRGKYWKKWYNTYAGKGTVAHYVSSAYRNGLA